jgi:hypothetical protein
MNRSGSSPSSVDIATNLIPVHPQGGKQDVDHPEWTRSPSGNLFRYYRDRSDSYSYLVSVVQGAIGYWWNVALMSAPQVNQYNMRNASGDYKEIWRSSKSHPTEADCIAAVTSNVDEVIGDIEAAKNRP